MANSYITLTNSNASLSKKYRVIQENYDDGTPNRAESFGRAMDGSADHSVGAVFKTWAPIIRVRHTEPETGYGTLANLETFYSYNNPNGTPSMNITFTDHHNVGHTVHFVGQMPKVALGCEIEGEQAWFLYKVQLIEVT